MTATPLAMLCARHDFAATATVIQWHLVAMFAPSFVTGALIRRVGARYASKSLLRFVPFAGQIAAAGISFGAMKLVGNSHIDDCYETVRRTLA